MLGIMREERTSNKSVHNNVDIKTGWQVPVLFTIKKKVVILLSTSALPGQKVVRSFEGGEWQAE